MLGVLLLLALAEDGLLVRQNKKLRSDLALENSTQQAAVGSALPPLAGFDTHGRKRVIAWVRAGGRAPWTLLIVFTKGCPFCALAWPGWSAVETRLPRGRWRVVAIDLSDPFLSDDFIARHDLSTATIFLGASLEPSSAIPYRLRWIPQTIALDPGGTVRWVHTGPLRAVDQESLRNLIQDSALNQTSAVSAKTGGPK